MDGTRQLAGPSPDYEYITPIGFSYYAIASSLSPGYYQTLLDRSWRRSGKMLYRPDQRRSCCPHYTIRLDSHEFKANKAQRQTINKFNRHVVGDEYQKEVARRYPKSREEAKRRDNEFVLVDRIHEAEYAQLRTPPEPAHKLVVSLESDEFTEEKYEVYNNYQMTVHNDPPESRTRRSFTRFLCSSPLRQETVTEPDGKKRRVGSFHQCYRLDGKLVAIGVLDLLPDCVSSVYFLYDESIHKFAPGKLGALHEIGLAQEGGYRWWYPGFYIHSCPKMRYKIDYSPQYLLDPESLAWDPLDKHVLSLLDKEPFVSLYLHRQKKTEVGVSDDSPQIDDPAQKSQEGSGGGSGGETNDSDDDDDATFLFNSGMPGIATLEDVGLVDLDNIPLVGSLGGPQFRTADLVGWETSTITQWPGIKAGIAELVAALGTDCVDVLCINLDRSG
ncbi:unnamed protein product [Clonostachys rhizophaga]|uniref:arginyltransferase n=1 Tax=Clonostachys rhizophaga TaxID=160324 RepID=A0A9N9YE97_9HYPO|nr:unnamed protein product [Clonostachys rhizophaga]